MKGNSICNCLSPTRDTILFNWAQMNALKPRINPDELRLRVTDQTESLPVGLGSPTAMLATFQFRTRSSPSSTGAKDYITTVVTQTTMQSAT